MSRYEFFPAACAALKIPRPVAEHKFHPTRKWRFDWAWVDEMVALEINGGVFVQGKHSRGAGQLKDMEKWSEAAAMGWRIVHCTPKQLASSELYLLVRRCLATTTVRSEQSL